jgi:hypothetical protein
MEFIFLSPIFLSTSLALGRDLLMHLLAMHGHLARGLDPQADVAAADFQDSDRDVPGDRDDFIASS